MGLGGLLGLLGHLKAHLGHFFSSLDQLRNDILQSLDVIRGYKFDVYTSKQPLTTPGRNVTCH